MYVIGITGGIGAGKSEILKYINNHCNCCVLTADEIAHIVREKGGECHEAILELLGSDLLQEDGTIDRALMAKRIFANADLLKQVNALIHPAVNRYIRDMISRGRKTQEWDAVFVEAALLIEEGYDRICDELWYIFAEESVRRIRLKETRGYDDAKIDNIIARQKSEEEFRKYCKVVIDNSNALENTYEQLESELRARSIYCDSRD